MTDEDGGTAITDEEARELADLEVAFAHNGGRGVEDAERIDELRFKRDAKTTHDDDLENALLEVERAKYRDSNDGEIDALSDALDEALALLGRQRPTLSDDEIERLENEPL